MDLVRLSKKMAVALRHKPWVFELELDEEGWTPLASLLYALQESGQQWATVTEDNIRAVVANQAKRRYEIQGDQVRALYGHSIPMLIKKIPAEPPAILYHGTSDSVLPIIQQEGLKPMSRQYVHFSVDQAMALEVARRKGGKTILLTVHARLAHQGGIQFYMGNERVWLCDVLPPQFFEVGNPDKVL